MTTPENRPPFPQQPPRPSTGGPVVEPQPHPAPGRGAAPGHPTSVPGATPPTPSPWPALTGAPTVGRPVHYVIKQGRSAGQVRPATVVSVSSTTANLVVTLDGSNDADTEFAGSATVLFGWATSIAYGAQSEPGTWH